MPQAKSSKTRTARTDDRVALLVLGMHRSGTSACARIANLLGAELPEDILPANEGNETGYWEPQRVVEFNDALLAEAGFGWDDPVTAEDIQERLPKNAAAEAAELVRQIYGDASLIVLKDPRCSMFPAFWIEAVKAAGYRPAVLYCTRPVSDVAASLAQRDGMNLEAAALLWAQTNIATLSILPDVPHLRLEYGPSIADWPAAIEQFGETAGFRWPRRLDEIRSELNEFLKPVRKSRPLTFRADIGDIVQRVAELVETGAAPAVILEKLAQTTAEWARGYVQAHQRYRRLAHELADERDEARDALQEADQREAVARDVIESLRGDLEKARGDHGEASERASKAQSVIESLRGDLEKARKDHGEAAARASAFHEVIGEIRSDLDKARADYTDAASRAAVAEAAIDTVRLDLEKARKDHAGAKARVDELEEQVSAARSERETLDRDFKNLEASVKAYREHAERLEADLSGTQSAYAQAESERSRLEEDFKDLEASVHAYKEHAERLATDLAETQSAYARADAERVALRMAHDDAQHRLAAIEASTFWRLTSPFRRILGQMPGVARFGRRGLKLVWWTLSLQLPARLKARRAALENAGQPAMDPEAPSTVLPPLGALSNFLSTEFDSGTASAMTGLIEKYELPFQREGMPAIKTVTPDERAEAWARALAELAPAAIAEPRVSIVVPAYNQIAFTLACIESIFRSAPRVSYEILVGDDNSSDGTRAASQIEIANVRWIRHDPNLGFVRNCNETARAARGDILVFLNNDTLVLPGWLDELVATLERDSTIGLAGSKLIYPDGRLQEAGGIFWQDGSAWNLGRFDDPRRPEFSYAREADYISGASIALPRAVWEDMGGFDELYVPAYTEDADLAFRVRAAGYRTLFQPRSQLLHFEGVSSGTDTSSGIKAYQVANLEHFKERWAETLARHRPNGVEPQLEKERDVTRRALFVDLTTPEPNHDAGSLVAVECMRSLQSAGFKVTFVPQDNFLWTRDFTAPLQRDGIEAIYHPYFSRFAPFAEARGGEFDLVFLHRYQTAERTLSDIRRHMPQARVVLLNADLHYLRELRTAELTGGAQAMREAEQTRDRELAVMRAVDLVLTHSTVERDMLAAELGADKVMLLPLIHDPEPTPAGFAERHEIGFIGGFGHPPNADAVDWFLAEVWPRVRQANGDARFALAGSKMPDRFKKLDGRDGVEVLGFVESLPHYFNRLRLSVVPLRVGAGAKGKVAASLAAGVPCVSTPIGIEGMQLTADRDVAVAQSAEEIAARILEVFSDETAWKRYREAGLNYADRVTSRESCREQIIEMTRRLGLAAGDT